VIISRSGGWRALAYADDSVYSIYYPFLILPMGNDSHRRYAIGLFESLMNATRTHCQDCLHHKNHYYQSISTMDRRLCSPKHAKNIQSQVQTLPYSTFSLPIKGTRSLDCRSASITSSFTSSSIPKSNSQPRILVQSFQT